MSRAIPPRAPWSPAGGFRNPGVFDLPETHAIRSWAFYLHQELMVAQKELKSVHSLTVKNFGQFSGQSVTLLSEEERRGVFEALELEQHHERRITFMAEALVRFRDRIVRAYGSP